MLRNLLEKWLVNIDLWFLLDIQIFLKSIEVKESIKLLVLKKRFGCVGKFERRYFGQKECEFDWKEMCKMNEIII